MTDRLAPLRPEMVENTMHCHCGSADCWDDGDYSWLASNSGWHGEINGCESSVFFIHGKKVREQRQIPELHETTVAEFIAHLHHWSEGLPEPTVMWLHDTGGGDAGLWIEGVREPNGSDLARLEECRARQRHLDRAELARLQRKLGAVSDEVFAVDPSVEVPGTRSTRDE